MSTKSIISEENISSSTLSCSYKYPICEEEDDVVVEDIVILKYGKTILDYSSEAVRGDNCVDGRWIWIWGDFMQNVKENVIQ